MRSAREQAEHNWPLKHWSELVIPAIMPVRKENYEANFCIMSKEDLSTPVTV